MSDNFLTQLLPNTTESEYRYLHHILKNPSELFSIPIQHYFNKDSRTIISAVETIFKKELIYSIDEVKHICKQQDNNFEVSGIDDILNKSCDNVLFIKEQIKENFLKHITITKLENFLVDASSKSTIPFDKLSTSIDDLYYSLHELNPVSLKSTEILSNNHLLLLEKRKNGSTQRSFGYQTLDKIITRPLAPEEMTGIVGMKGGGKSALVKNIENRLASKGVPILSINLEMSDESTMDRILCMRMNLPLQELIRKDVNPRTEARIKKEIEFFKNIPNYLFYSEPHVTLDQLNSLIYKAKLIFKNKGILKDEYIVVVIDLLDMIEEFSYSENSYQIKRAINILHGIFKEHKSHGILLLQANENKLRGGKVFKKPEELDFYKVGLEDIEGSASISQRCRVIMSMTRPIQMKKRFFPEQSERWDLEVDKILLNVCKQNDGPSGYAEFVLTNTFRVYPYEEENITEL